MTVTSAESDTVVPVLHETDPPQLYFPEETERYTEPNNLRVVSIPLFVVVGA